MGAGSVLLKLLQVFESVAGRHIVRDVGRDLFTESNDVPSPSHHSAVAESGDEILGKTSETNTEQQNDVQLTREKLGKKKGKAAETCSKVI